MKSSRFDVFLSHNSNDKPLVEALAHSLVAEGIQPWLDKWNLIPGDPWQTAVEEALINCSSCAVFIGPSGIGPWQNEEMRAAIDRRVAESKGRFRVIPVLLPGAAREERSHLPAFLAATTWVEFRKNIEEQDPFRRLVAGIRGIAPGAGLSQLAQEGVCPYRGLQFFDVEHSQFFLGREALAEWMLNELRDQSTTHQENRFLAVVGPSGSGKSSLARAGLLARLKKGSIESSENWPIAIIRPGSNPVENLAVATGKLTQTGESVQTLANAIDGLRKDSRTLHLISRLALRDRPASHRLVVLVDQFEEVFTMCQDEQLRRSFVDNIIYAATVQNGQTMIILTLRSDYYGHCSTFPSLAAALSDHQILVGPMTDEELRMAIERPAQLLGCEFEPGLVEILLRDVKGQAGGLPLLEFALLELWGQRDGCRLTHEAYKTTGGVEGALESRIEQTYGHLTEDGKRICKGIFLRLVQVGDGTAVTKRRVLLHELMPAEGESIVQMVVQTLAVEDTRLLILESEPQHKDNIMVEVAHEALIRKWRRLRDWLDEDKEFLLWRQRLLTMLSEWQRVQSDEGALLRATLLAEAEGWLESRAKDLNADEVDFIKRSISLRERARKAQRAIRRRITAGLVGGLILVSILASVALYQWKQTDTQRKIALSRQLAAQAEAMRTLDPTSLTQCILLACEAYKRRPSGEASQSLFSSLAMLRRQEASISCKSNVVEVLFTHSGQFLIARLERRSSGFFHKASLRDTLIIVYNVDSNRIESQVGLPPDETLNAIKLDPCDRFIAVNIRHRMGSTVKLIDLRTGKDTNVVTDTAKINAIDISPDGRQMALACENGNVRLCDLVGGKRNVTIWHGGHVGSVAFTSDGQFVISASSDDVVRIWDTHTRRCIFSVIDHKGIKLLRVSPSRRHVAIATWGSTARIWDFAAKRELGSIGHQDQIRGLALSRDGKYMATASDDNTCRVLEIQSGREHVLAGHSRKVRDVVFSPDCLRLATASWDGTARLWNMSTGQEEARFPHDTRLNGIVFSPRGDKLATFDDEWNIRIWSTEKPFKDTRITHRAIVDRITFTRDGELMATATATRFGGQTVDNIVRIWDIRHDVEYCRLAHGKGIEQLAFAENGQSLTTYSLDEYVRVWNLNNGNEIAKTSTTNLTWVQISQEGKVFLGVEGDSMASVFDATNGKPMWRQRIEGGAKAVDLSPNGKLLSLRDSSGTRAQIVEPATGRIVTTISRKQSIKALCFSPGGKYLSILEMAVDSSSSLSRDEQARISILEAVTGREIIATRSEVGAPFEVSGTQWVLFGAEEKYAAVVVTSYSVEIWELNTGRMVFRIDNESRIAALTLSSDHGFLAIAGKDGTIHIWDLVNKSELFARQYRGEVSAVSFTPNAKYLVVATTEKSIHVSIWDPDTLFGIAQSSIRCNLSKDEWKKFLGEEPYEKTFSAIDSSSIPRVAVNDFLSNFFDKLKDIEGIRSARSSGADAKRLLEESENCAGNNNYDDAYQKAEEALSLGLAAGIPELTRDPEQDAKMMVINSMLSKSMACATSGNVASAIKGFEEFEIRNPTVEIPPVFWNNLCWFGSLAGHPREVLFAGDKAVVSSYYTNSVNLYRDTRGLARALCGNLQGAVEDFQAFVQWAHTDMRMATRCSEREEWIHELKAGRNPFDAKTLAALKKE
jgi:WD40 repeat protein